VEIKERIKFILKETNPWWRAESFRLRDYSERRILFQIEKFLPLRQIIALAGLRRTGKTTLILKIVENYLKSLCPKKILYFSFDDFASLEIEDILCAYKEIINETDLKQDKLLFCFDEIQKLGNWQEKLKLIYDAYPNIKIIISGSESLFLRKKMKETLAGRIFEFKLSLLTFKEYIGFTKNDSVLKNIELHREKILELYKGFLRTNGFPELAGVEDEMIIHKYLKESVIDKILFKDIPALFKIRNAEVLSEILDIIAFQPGQIIDITKLSKELGLTRQAVSSYLDYLEKSFLVKKVYNFSKNLRKQKRSLKKYYPAIIFPSVIEHNFPASFETSLMWQLDIQYFYRDPYKNEVDAVIVDKERKITALEIKTGDIDLTGIRRFIKKYKVKGAIVLTWERREKYRDAEALPFYKYLLMSV